MRYLFLLATVHLDHKKQLKLRGMRQIIPHFKFVDGTVEWTIKKM